MKTYYALISYDLKTPPGNHSKFKTEMEKLGWSFSIDNKPLPNTTCWKSYQAQKPDDVNTLAQADVIKAGKNLTGTDRIELEKIFFLAFSAADWARKCL